MDKAKLKRVIKPIIEECVKEMFFEKGFLSNMIQEVVEAQSKTVLKESSSNPYEKHLNYKTDRQVNRELAADAYQDIKDKNEPKTPVKKASGDYKKYGAMKDVDPANPGVSIDKLLEGMNFKIFND